MENSNEEDKKYEKLGRALCTIQYLFYAFKFIFIVSVIAFIILFFLHFYLWLAPIIGVGIFIIFQGIRRLFIRSLIRFGRYASRENKRK